MNSFYKFLFFVICACTVSCTESSLGFTPSNQDEAIVQPSELVDEYYLKMNWGYGGSYDNNNYDLGTYSWITDANPFTYYPKMIYGFKPDNL